MWKRSVLLRLYLLIAVLLSLPACGTGGESSNTTSHARKLATIVQLVGGSEESSRPDIGEPAPDFAYTHSDGTMVKLSDLRGKKVLINFWATWCLPCQEEMPELQQAADQYGDELVVLGINKRESLELIAPFADRLDIGFALIADPAGEVVSRYKAINLPTSYFINTDGTVGSWKIGALRYDVIKEQLDLLQ